MPIYALSEEPVFPPADHAQEDGLLAVGGDLAAPRLLAAYHAGIFPWPHRGMPLLWFSPDPRMVLYPAGIRLQRSLKQIIRRGDFEIRLDTAFAQVMTGCATARRKGARGTWITRPMIKAYGQLHELGAAHSAEAWQDGRLVGGLYGVSLGKVFFGESMFALQPDASKVAFATLVAQLTAWGFGMIDCQTHTAHLERFGAALIPRRQFLAELAGLVDQPGRQQRWQLQVTPAQVCST